MSFHRPQLADLIRRIQTDIQTRFPGTQPALASSLSGVLARVEAGSVHELYGALKWLSINLLPDTKDADMLARWATIYGVNRLTATTSAGDVDFTGNGTVTAGTLLQAPNGVQYQVDTDVIVPGSGAVTSVTTGAKTNLVAGIKLSFVSPVAGVDGQAVVNTAGISGGADKESVDAWSQRLLQRIQQPPQGGSVNDYKRWARASHPSITNVWVKRATPTPGSVTVYLMTYDAPDSSNGIPSNTTISVTDNYIRQRAPVAARLYVFGPLPKTIDLTVQLTPNNADVQQAVLHALKDLFQREAAPGEAIPMSHVDQAISGSVGEYDHRLVGVSQTDLTPVTGEILLLGTVTFMVMP